MYDFWYNVIKKKYGEKAQLLYTDTDSLMMLIETTDAYADMWPNKHRYDFSGTPKATNIMMTHRKIQGRG